MELLNRFYFCSKLSIIHKADVNPHTRYRIRSIDSLISLLTNALLTSGGVSMGQLDLVKPYLAKRGHIHFGRVRAKPGKPVTFATIEGIPVFAMPGFPVSALVSFEIYVRPALLKMAGHRHLQRPRRWATLTHKISHSAGRTEFQRAIVTHNAASGQYARPNRTCRY